MTLDHAAGGSPMRPVMLVIGNLARWKANGRNPPQLDGFHYMDFAQLTAVRLAEIAPDVILSGLVGDDFDAVEMAGALQAIGYRGRYRVIARGLPDPQSVRAEIARAAPEVDFNILSLP